MDINIYLYKIVIRYKLTQINFVGEDRIRNFVAILFSLQYMMGLNTQALIM